MGNNPTWQCVKEATTLPVIASCLLGGVMSNAHADTVSAVIPASSVAMAVPSAQLQNEMIPAIPPDAITDYRNLSTENKATLTSFYQGFKERNAVSNGLYAMICLLIAIQNNDAAVKTMMQPTQKQGLGLDPVSRSIRTLKQIFPDTDTSGYGNEFRKYRDYAEQIYKQGTELQAALDKNVPEKVQAAREKLAESERVRDESRQRLTVTRVELDKSKTRRDGLQKTDAQMGQVVSALPR